MEQKVGVGLVFEAPDAAAELVELREAEAVGPFDDNRIAVGNIQTALNDRRADEDLVAAGDKLGHDSFQLLGVHLAVAGADGEIGHELAEASGDELDGLHPIVQVKNLAAAADFVVHGVDHDFFIVGFDDGLNRVAVRRSGLDHAEVARSGECHVERARNGRGAH